MDVAVQSKCGFKRYGPECNFCDVPDDRGYCDPNGFPVCLAGFHGPNCAHFDGCRKLNCAPFASCAQVGDSFACFCDGTSGKRCELGFDPCEGHICEHNGTCAVTGEHLNFAKCVNCSPGWDGIYCERKLNACEMETLKLGHPPCRNGGHCVVNPAIETQFTCLCAPGWHGPRCATSFSKAPTIVVAVSIILVAIIICTFAIVCYSRFRYLMKLSQKQRGIVLADIKAETNNHFPEDDLYEVPRDQITSANYMNSVIWKKNISTFVTADSQRRSSDNEGYETMPDCDQKPYSDTAEPRLTEEGENYEPISINFQSTFKSQVSGVLNNKHGLFADNGLRETAKRPLPPTPREGRDESNPSTKTAFIVVTKMCSASTFMMHVVACMQTLSYL
ncbi:hypothetical protein Aperf_G00000001091 [Anoplocephala perfoliata]